MYFCFKYKFKMYQNMIKTIIEFKKLQEELPKKITESKYKTSHFVKELGLTSATYYRKVSSNNFTTDEMLKIAELVDPKAFYKWKFEQEIKQAEAQIASGNYHTNEEVIAIIQSKIDASQ